MSPASVQTQSIFSTVSRDNFNFRVGLGRISELGYGMLFGSDVKKQFFQKRIKVLWSSIFVTLMANKIGGLQFGIYRNCQISSRVFHTAVAALPLTKANRSDFE